MNQTVELAQSVEESSRSDSFTVLSSQCSNIDSPELCSKSEAPTEPLRPVWVGAESFPEGFGGQPFTYYLLMPRFSATLDDLLKGTWNPSSETNLVQGHEHSEAKTTGSSDGSSASNGCSTASESASFITQGDTLSREDGFTHSSIESDIHTGTVESIIKTPKSVSATTPKQSPSKCLLDVDEIVAILAQLFDAVAELERLGVAHRDIKPNNILLRPRPVLPANQRLNVSRAQAHQNASDTHDRIWLDDDEVLSTNTRFHVAITDFGCAIRTTPKIPEYFQTSFLRLICHLFTPNLSPSTQPDMFTHSGNVALLAPEIAVVLTSHHSTLPGSDIPSPLDYSRADIWALATLVYPLFGLSNPFIDSTLSSATYSESELPSLPDRAPGVMCWVVMNCLQRNPSSRPPAALVADVLHSWCLLRHSCRRRQRNRVALCTRGMNVASNQSADTTEADSIDLRLSTELEDTPPRGELPPRLASRLRSFLNVCWAADWLTGPARPPNGLRVSFYRRVTLTRLATCLHIVFHEEAIRARRITNSIAAAVGPIKFPSGSGILCFAVN
ncbi:Mitochondrial [Fasciola hepatica]|uniref:non-specific serine/threonine protein kinase n=1 Tax=Fasciola hepatica TaxID=6192 RepID=A0A4E0RZZ1_FASHE|nr:Mitochondrial [Fasciola hepatica]